MKKLLKYLKPRIPDQQYDHMTQQLINNVISSESKTVADVMIDKAKVISVEKHHTIETFLPIFQKYQHSRYPILSDNQQVSGILIAKDIFTNLAHSQKPIIELKRNTIFTPKTQKLSHLLLELQQARRHLAIVIDEYHHYEGIITIENIIESWVGAIEDEHDQINSSSIRKVAKHQYTCSGTTNIEHINQVLDQNIDHSKFETISGIITHHIGKIPCKGDQVSIDNLTFKVLSANERVVQKVIITIS